MTRAAPVFASSSGERDAALLFEVSTEYEKFVQDVYQALVHQNSDVKNIEVQHDVTLTGKSGATHQIDVYWTFEVAGQVYRTCIECKHYTRAVKKMHVAAFATVLSELGPANGIFVTTVGYQSGAKLLAADQNIRLVKVNYTIQEFQCTVVLQMPQFEAFRFDFDIEGCKAVLAAAGLTTFSFQQKGRHAILRDPSGTEMDLGDAIHGKYGSTPGETVVELDGWSLRSDVGWLPLRAALFDLSFDESSEQFSVKAEEAVKAIVEDVLENTRSYVGADGKVRPAPSAD